MSPLKPPQPPDDILETAGLQGPQGDQGEPGIDGIDGATGATGIQGVPGDALGVLGIDVWASQANPAAVTDWGPIINNLLSSGDDANKVRLLFTGHEFPFSTMIDTVQGSYQDSSALFEGVAGRGWYLQTVYDRGTPPRLVWKGGASPVVAHADGAITSGDATLTSASAPWTEDSVFYSGMPITVEGAGTAGADLETFILSKNSSSSVELADNAATTVSGADYSFTNWDRAINGKGGQSLQFTDIKIVYDNPDFDGILIDMRSGLTTWAARGYFHNCEVYAASQVHAAGAPKAYALLHISGHGEGFSARDTQFQGAKCLVRGMYQNNTDDVYFEHCSFYTWTEVCFANPGRYWTFNHCIWSGSMAGGLTAGTTFKMDKFTGANLQGEVVLIAPKFWDYADVSGSAAAMTSGDNILTVAAGPFTLDDSYYVDRCISVAGAGAAGGFLNTLIVRKLSATQLELLDDASTTVASAAYSRASGPLFYSTSDSTLRLNISEMFTWFTPRPEFKLFGTGWLKIDGWTTTKQHRWDLPQYQQSFELGDSVSRNKMVRLSDLRFSTPNADETDPDLLVLDGGLGHDIEISHTPFARNFRRIELPAQEAADVSAAADDSPSVTVAAGQTGGIAAGSWGNDMVGTVAVNTGAGGAIAGNLADFTFINPIRSISGTKSGAAQGLLCVQLTPVQALSGETGDGSAAAAAGAYVISAKTDDVTGFTLAITNAVSGAKNLRWSYRVTRL